MEHRAFRDRCLRCACAKFHGISKYGNKRSEGFDSKFERNFSGELDLRVKAGDVTSYRHHVRIPLCFTVDGIEFRICDYVIDYVVECADGITEYVEVKGRETADWRLKWKMFEALYSRRPLTRLLVVKERHF